MEKPGILQPHRPFPPGHQQPVAAPFVPQRFQYAVGVAPFNLPEENAFWGQIQGLVNQIRLGQAPNPGVIRGQYNLAGINYAIQWVVGNNFVTVINHQP
ncbi:MAG TPA: hypothetical protein VFO39_09775 [Candidatus Sulfotelmatobacter sp.]|nr:hypothetical protein [Candidatus Sulfotelmatobacter sp.]